MLNASKLHILILHLANTAILKTTTFANTACLPSIKKKGIKIDKS